MPQSRQISSAPPTTFGASIAQACRRYADFGGRAGVPEFWWFVLLVAAVGVGLGVLVTYQPALAVVADGLATFWMLATLLPTLAVSVRRLRDGGNSWLQVLWLFVPIAGVVILILRFCDPSIPGEAAADDLS